MIRLSTGLRNAIAGNDGLGAMMNGGIIRVFSGTQPASPDLSPGSTELARITTEGKTFYSVTDPEGAGLIVAVVSPGALISVGEWRMKGIAVGTAGWFRWCWSQVDPLTESSFYPRIDGTIGESFALGDTSITMDTDVLIGSFQFVIGME